MRWVAAPAMLVAGLSVAAWGCSSDEGGGRGEPGGGPSPPLGMDAGAEDPLSLGNSDASAPVLPPLTDDAGTRFVETDSCSTADCTAGQRCEPTDGGVLCINNECEDIECTDTERCELHAQGGVVCVSIACDSDVDCDPAEHCGGTVCEPDTCEGGSRECDALEVLECASNGSESVTRFSCSSGGYFTSECVEDTLGFATCTCEDDWDCPAFTECEVGECQGTGIEPSCSLPPIPFTQTPPNVEIHWGGDARNDDSARDGTPARNPAPWPSFSHGVNTPMVANLDDDNGDGLVNELDFPEILFITHKDNNPWDEGVVRAIHGGGPNKGADYFARCGDKLWTSANPTSDTCSDSEPDGDSGAPMAVGDLDGDGIPEIVYPTENDTFRILDNTGAQIYRLTTPWTAPAEGETIAIANLDYAGYAEIIVGRTVYVLGDDAGGNLIVTHIVSGTASRGINDFSFMACPADITSDPGQEIAVGATLYRLPTLGACASPPCTASLSVVWNGLSANGNTGLTGEGFCAVADVWGANPALPPGPDNPPDGKPEVILIDDGDLTILNGETGVIIDDRNLGGGTRGGAPNVDDFDGDGFMEIASALENFYIVVDLQASTGAGGACPDWPATITRQDMAAGAHNPNPARTPGGSCTQDSDCDAAAVCNQRAGACVCLHNQWQRGSDDDSSRATSSSVFDFNGDGAAEVIYNDECEFRVYDGVNGEMLFAELNRSRTGIENPVVADVDNDGNAEIVNAVNTAIVDRCDDDPVVSGSRVPQGPNGIRVWGDPTDTWVSARRIWNQQSYHVTNVTEAGGIPLHAPESWGAFNGRVYNTYRSQPRNFGVAPDLTVVDVGVSSPDAGCGVLSDNIDITFQIRNDGDLRVGPGVVIALYGTWGGSEEELLDGTGTPLAVPIRVSIEPGNSVLLSVNFRHDDNSRSTLPDSVRVVVDPTTVSLPDGAERECREDNNEGTADVEPGQPRPDLALDLGAAREICPDGEVDTVVENVGTQATGDVTVRYYAGDPSQGGTFLYEQVIAGPIDPGDRRTFTATIPDFPPFRSITIFAVVDPDDEIDECAEGNNKDGADNPIECNPAPE